MKTLLILLPLTIFISCNDSSAPTASSNTDIPESQIVEALENDIAGYNGIFDSGCLDANNYNIMSKEHPRVFTSVRYIISTENDRTLTIEHYYTYSVNSPNYNSNPGECGDLFSKVIHNIDILNSDEDVDDNGNKLSDTMFLNIEYIDSTASLYIDQYDSCQETLYTGQAYDLYLDFAVDSNCDYNHTGYQHLIKITPNGDDFILESVHNSQIINFNQV